MTIKAELFESNTDASALIDSIKNDTDLKIIELTENSKNEIISLYKKHEADIDNFKKEKNEETELKTKAEVSRIENRAAIEKKKLKLAVIEEIIENLINTASEQLRELEGEKYLEFLTKTVSESLSNIKGENISVELSESDMKFKDKIYDTIIKKSNYKGNISFTKNESIIYGGAIVIDIDKGLSYNSTLERIIFRNHDKIRKQIFEIISKRIDEIIKT